MISCFRFIKCDRFVMHQFNNIMSVMIRLFLYAVFLLGIVNDIPKVTLNLQ